jgi:hypothetical protein
MPAIRRAMLDGLLPRLAPQARNAASVVGLAGNGLRWRAAHHRLNNWKSLRLGAAAGLGFFRAGEFQGESEFVGGWLGGQIVLVGSEADRGSARFGSGNSHYRLQSDATLKANGQ